MYIATLHVHFKAKFIKIYLSEHQIFQNPKKPTVVAYHYIEVILTYLDITHRYIYLDI